MIYRAGFVAVFTFASMSFGFAQDLYPGESAAAQRYKACLDQEMDLSAKSNKEVFDHPPGTKWFNLWQQKEKECASIYERHKQMVRNAQSNQAQPNQRATSQNPAPVVSPPRANMQKPPVNNQNSAAKSSGASKKSYVDSQGQACVTVTSNGVRNLRGTSGPITAYDYMIRNGCSTNFNLQITTVAGWNTEAGISKMNSRKWSCTDGHPGNKDCGGGIASYTVK